MRNKAKCMPMCRSLCACLVDKEGPTIVENNANVIEHVMCCANATKPSAHFALTTCPSSVDNIPGNNNAMFMLMKAQR